MNNVKRRGPGRPSKHDTQFTQALEKLKNETYEEYCDRHKKHGTKPMVEEQWERILKNDTLGILH